MSITSLRGSTLPNKSFRAGRAKTRNVVTIAPDTATTFANGASISTGGGGGGSSVTISNVSVTDSGYIVSNATPYIDSTGGYIKITGTGFATGCTVYVGGSAATSTTFISSTEVRAQVGAASSNAQSVYVVNTDSSVAILLNAITYSGTPSWSTAASLGTQISDIAFTIPLSATSDSSIVYTLASGSSTPSGTTLFSNGVFAGTVTGITSDTNYSFTVVATDIENQLSARAFTVSVSSGDQYFYTTAMLLNGDANVWITDSSTNKFLPTVAADAKPTAFSPYNYNWSAYFDGTNDYLACTYNTTFGSGNFTVECWVYMPSITNTYSSTIIGTTNYNGVDRGWALAIDPSGYPMFYLYNSGTGVTTTSSTLLPANRWNHLAAVRSGTTVTIYMNGVSVASGTNATSDNFSNSIYIGTNSTSFAIGVSTYSYAGYISNARIVVGVAVYTGAFTPPTTILGNTQSSGTNISAITGTSTSLLTLQDNRFKDNSSNASTITKTGDVVIKSFGPFTETDLTTGSGYFDGTGDWLAYSSNSAFAFGTGPYTVDAWIYLTATSTGGSPIFNAGGATNGFSFQLQGSNFGTPVVFLNKDGSGLVSTVNSTTVVRLNEWTHVAISRASTASNDTKIFINGRLDGTGTDNNDWTVTTTPRIGASGSAGYTFAGYMTDVRVIKGSALYTANFTPATSSVSSVANTSLLTLQYRRGDNNHRFVDEAGFKHPLTRAGQVSQGSFSPFSPAGWSAYFDGTGDYLTVVGSSNLAFSTSDFTIECWVYLNALPVSPTGAFIYDGRPGADGAYTTLYVVHTTYVLTYYVNTAARINGTTPLATGQWYHVLVARVSGSTRMFLNGTQEGSTYTDSTAYLNGTSRPLIGNNGLNLTGLLTGYISNLRVLKGTGLYTANFTPATSSLTTVANVQLQTLQDNRFVDNSSNNYTITRNGDVKIQAFSPFRPSGAYTPSLHGGSAYFDGTGDYITTVSTTSTILPTSSTNTFTIDGWLYPTALGALKWIIGDLQATGGVNNVSVDISSSNFIELYWYDGASKRATSTTAVVLNQWNYFAIVVNNNAITIYVNSTTAGQGGTTTLTNRSNGTTGWSMGAWNSADYYTGYMSGIRWTNGVARTISSIPTAPPSLDANTSVLMNFTQGGVVDASARNVFETVADAKISNVASKFGTGAMYFDGTGDYLTARNNPNQGFGIGDFTIECWMYCTDASTYRGLMGQGDNSTQGWGLYFNPNPTPLIIFIYGGSISYGAGVVAIGSWCHVAVTRYGTGSNNLRFYVNGSLVTNTTVTNNLSSTSPTYIGATAGGSYPFAGYLDDVRITAGYARYTGASLTVPTQTFLTK